MYVAFLDIQKAFDTVWIEGLLFKLLKAGMSRKAWGILRNSYQNYQCAAFVNGVYDRWFIPSRGVHQGAPLSMCLYQLYINGLLSELRSSSYGAMIGDIDVSCPASADDIAICALHKLGLNVLLEIAHEYSQTWKFNFSPSKCVVMIWGRDRSPQVNIKLGEMPLQVVNETKHLGIILKSNHTRANAKHNARIGHANYTLHASKGLGSMAIPVPTNVVSKLYWTIGIAKMTYGVEATHLSPTEIHTMEAAHRKNAKLAQCLPMNTPTPAPLATIGWMSMNAYIALKKLYFLWQILLLPQENIYNKIVKYIIVKFIGNLYTNTRPSGPLSDMLYAVSKYNLETLLYETIIGRPDGGINKYKSIIKQRIWEHEVRNWKASCVMYKELDGYQNNVSEVRLNNWWKFSNKYPSYTIRAAAVVSLLCGVEPRGLQYNFKCNRCLICDDHTQSSPTHVLFMCRTLSDIRDAKWDTVINTMPIAMQREIFLMSSDERTNFITSCLGNCFIPEWQAIYKSIADFIWSLYVKRDKLYKVLIEDGGPQRG